MSRPSLDRIVESLSRSSRRRKSMTRSPPPLTELLSKRHFKVIDHILQDRTIETDQWFDEQYSTLGENCLHATMKARPPPALVELMLNRLVEHGITEPELSVDELGRTPLHHAVGYSCSPEVIKVLVDGPAGETSVRAQDVEGRLPLHLAMRPYLLYTGADHKIHPTSSLRLEEACYTMRETVAILLNVCPQTVHVKDDMTRTPSEYAKHLASDKNFYRCARVILDEMKLVEHSSRTTKARRSRHSGMVIEISSVTSSTDDDDLSVLSWEDL